MKRFGFVKWLVAITLLAIMFLPMQAYAEEEEDTYTVYITLEGLTLSYGFFVEPTAIMVESGATAWDATVALFELLGLEYELDDWGMLERVYGILPDGGSLGSFDRTEEAGWMFTHNHTMAQAGAIDLPVADGDVLRWQFSIAGWGADLGLGEDEGFWMDPPFRHADETEVIRAIVAYVNESNDEAAEILLNEIAARWVNAKYDAAIETASNEEEFFDVTDMLIRFMYIINDSAWANPFIDVDDDREAMHAVRFVNYTGVMVGVSSTHFDPYGMLTYAMAATILWRIAGEPAVMTTDTAWYAQPIAWLDLPVTDIHGAVTLSEFVEMASLANFPIDFMEPDTLVEIVGVDSFFYNDDGILNRFGVAMIITFNMWHYFL